MTNLPQPVQQNNPKNSTPPQTSAYPNAPYTPPTAPKTFKEYVDLEDKNFNITDDNTNHWQEKEDQGLSNFLASKGKSLNDPFDVNLYNEYMHSAQYVQNAEYQSAEYDWQKHKNDYKETWMRPSEPKLTDYELHAYNMLSDNLKRNGGTLNDIYNSMAKQDPHKTNQLINYLKKTYKLNQGTQSVTGSQLYDAIQKLDI